LDSPLLEREGQSLTIRENYLKDLGSFEWSKLKDVPFHMWFATTTGVITADNQLVVSIRSGMQAVSTPDLPPNTLAAAMSCAEGMLRPSDAYGGIESQPSPFITACRSLQDELGLNLAAISRVTSSNYWDWHSIRSGISRWEYSASSSQI
jgi:hypothetical protein